MIGWEVISNIEAKTLKIDPSTFIKNLVKKESLRSYNAINIMMKADSFSNMLEKNYYQKTDLKIY